MVAATPMEGGMLRLYATAFAPIIGGLLLAVVAWLIARRSGASQGGATGGRLAPVLAGGIPLVLVITLRLWQYSPVLFAARLPRAVFEWLPSVQFILPLIDRKSTRLNSSHVSI